MFALRIKCGINWYVEISTWHEPSGPVRNETVVLFIQKRQGGVKCQTLIFSCGASPVGPVSQVSFSWNQKDMILHEVKYLPLLMKLRGFPLPIIWKSLMDLKSQVVCVWTEIWMTSFAWWCKTMNQQSTTLFEERVWGEEVTEPATQVATGKLLLS